jgi:RNA polymerase sigma factor (sigma-70 family)
VLRAKRGDAGARALLLEELKPLIGSIARNYRGCPAVNRSELMQEGAVGVLRALERYDPARDTPFWAYATWWVRQAMQRLVAELGQPVVLSDRALRQLARVKDARRAHLQFEGAEPSSTELATETGMSRDHVDRLIAAERTPRALDAHPAGRDETPSTYGDQLPDPVAEDQYDSVMSRQEVDSRRRRFARLSERERGVLSARFGIGCAEETLREIGGRLGLTAERVRQIEQHALGELRGG